jgi:hypothetical protein
MQHLSQGRVQPHGRDTATHDPTMELGPDRSEQDPIASVARTRGAVPEIPNVANRARQAKNAPGGAVQLKEGMAIWGGLTASTVSELAIESRQEQSPLASPAPVASRCSGGR